MKENIEQYRSQAEVYRRRLDELRAKIEKLETKEQLPIIKKKYEGKFFKYDNGYSGSDRWWMYSYCKKLIGLNTAIADTFETTTSKEHHFTNSEKTSLFIFATQITQTEYKKALKAFIKNLPTP